MGPLRLRNLTVLWILFLYGVWSGHTNAEQFKLMQAARESHKCEVHCLPNGAGWIQKCESWGGPCDISIEYKSLILKYCIEQNQER
jgi:hypothetical protein